MKILEKLGISFITFLIIYAFISIGLRMLKLTSIYNAHMFGGVMATIIAVGLLMYLLLKKKRNN